MRRHLRWRPHQEELEGPVLGLQVICMHDPRSLHACIHKCSNVRRGGGQRTTVYGNYKRVKGRSNTVEQRIRAHPRGAHKPHATSQPSHFSHTHSLTAQRQRWYSWSWTQHQTQLGAPGVPTSFDPQHPARCSESNLGHASSTRLEGFGWEGQSGQD